MTAKLRPLLSAAYVVAIAVFAFVFLRSHWDAIVDNVASAGAVSLFLAFCLSLGGLVSSALSFRAILGGLGHRLPLAGTFRIYFVSQLGKYLPGSVWPAIAQVRLGAAYGVSNQANLASFFVGLLLSIAVGGTTGFVVLASIDPGLWLAPAALSVVALGVGVVLLPKWTVVMQRLPSFVQRRLPEAPLDRRSLLVAMALLVLSWVLHGLQVAVLSDALGLDLEFPTLRSIGAFAVAYAGGVLFVIAPAGAGVREALMASILGASDVALVTAVVLLSRVVLLVADVGLGTLGAVLTRSVGSLPKAASREPR